MTFDSDEELSPAERKKVEKMQERQAKAVARFPIMIMRMREYEVDEDEEGDDYN